MLALGQGIDRSANFRCFCGSVCICHACAGQFQRRFQRIGICAKGEGVVASLGVDVQDAVVGNNVGMRIRADVARRMALVMVRTSLVSAIDKGQFHGN